MDHPPPSSGAGRADPGVGLVPGAMTSGRRFRTTDLPTAQRTADPIGHARVRQNLGGVMAIRVRYKPTDLSEGVVEIIHEADDYKLAETGEIILLEVWTDDDDGGRVKRSRVGVLRAGAWDSVVLMAEASGDSDG